MKPESRFELLEDSSIFPHTRASAIDRNARNKSRSVFRDLSAGTDPGYVFVLISKPPLVAVSSFACHHLRLELH